MTDAMIAVDAELQSALAHLSQTISALRVRSVADSTLTDAYEHARQAQSRVVQAKIRLAEATP